MGSSAGARDCSFGTMLAGDRDWDPSRFFSGVGRVLCFGIVLSLVTGVGDGNGWFLSEVTKERFAKDDKRVT